MSEGLEVRQRRESHLMQHSLGTTAHHDVGQKPSGRTNLAEIVPHRGAYGTVHDGSLTVHQATDDDGAEIERGVGLSAMGGMQREKRLIQQVFNRQQLHNRQGPREFKIYPPPRSPAGSQGDGIRNAASAEGK